MMDEVWLPIKGYEGSYEVSNLGRLRSLDRAVLRSDGKTMKFQGKLYLPHLDKNGYQSVGLRLARQPRFMAKIHRLVAIAFIPNPENKPHVNHIDGIKTNNVVNNLEWMTNLENHAHAVASGLTVYQRGEAHMNATLTSEIVQEIRSLRQAGHTYPQIGSKLNINYKHAWKVGTRKLWKHLL